MAEEPPEPPAPSSDPPDPASETVFAGRDATPSVLAVVVAHDPGEWFADTLESLASQDYPRLSVLVVDASGGNGDEVAERVGDVLPSAEVVGASDGKGFSRAANSVLDQESGPPFLLICHDDVVLGADVVRTLVTEALRSNAGIAGPKLVDWARPDRLAHVGYVVDRFGVAADVVEPDELDQEQHDAVVDVFALPSACMLVRRDLFTELGGFDPEITFRGEEVDLCWRAHLAGARVLVVPDAVVRHREQLSDRTGVDDVRRLRARHQLRSVLVNSSVLSLLITLPLAAVLTVGEALIALVTGRFGQVGHVLSAWTWNLRRLRSIRRRRRDQRELVRVSRSDVRALQERGSVRINAFIRGQIGRGSRFEGASRDLVSAMRTGTTRGAALAWVFALGFVIFGSRDMVLDGVPAIGGFAAFPDGPGDLLAGWWGGWHDRDLGSVGVIPGSALLYAVLGWITGGALGLVRTLSIIGPVVVGLLGVWRMAAITGSRRAQIGALAGYLALPLFWSAMSEASLTGLHAYAAAPWVIAVLMRGQAVPPYRPTARPFRVVASAALGLGLTIGVLSLFEPTAVVIVVPAVAGLFVGGIVAVRPKGTLRLLTVAVAGSLIGAVLAAPMIVDLLTTAPSWDVIASGRDGDAYALPLDAILRFSPGPEAPSPLVWLLGLPLFVPLLVGRSWRLELSIRFWSVALAGWGVTFAAARGWIPFGLPDPAVLLAPAAAAVAGLIATSVAVVEHDFRSSRFGWRQLVVPAAAAAALVGSVPALGALDTGTWDLPTGGFDNTLPFESPDEDGSYRVLWIADPDFLPIEGRPLAPGLAWTATLDGLPTMIGRQVPADDGSAQLLETSLIDAIDGGSSRFGRVLAGFGVRYVVILERLAPAPFAAPDTATEVPAVVVDAFADQLDMREIEGVNSAVHVFANAEPAVVRTARLPDFDTGVDSPDDLQGRPLAAPVPVLPGEGTHLEGRVPEGTEVLVLQTPDAGWRLEVAGEGAARRRALGWANAFVPADGGDASLDYGKPLWRAGLLVLQMAVFVVLAGAALRRLVSGGTA